MNRISLMRHMHSKAVVAAAMVATLAFVVGLSAPMLAGNYRSWLALAALALLPACIYIATSSLPAAAFAIAATQIFEFYEIYTPVVSFSVSSIFLIAFLSTRVALLRNIVRESTATLLCFLCFVSIIGSQFLQFSFVPLGSMLRAMVTLFSFAMFWAAGVIVARDRRGLHSLCYGALFGLYVLGASAVLVQSGALPKPERISPARTILGFTSPFDRNYGLSTGFAEVALLLPLCIPLLALAAVRLRRNRAGLLAWLIMVGLLIFTLMFFQSRSMIIELLIVVPLAIVLSSRKVAFHVISLVLMLLAGAYLWPSFSKTDEISSTLRETSYETVLNRIRDNPRILLRGDNISATLQLIRDETQFGQLVGAAPIHNMFLGEILRGGIWAGLGGFLLFAIPAFFGYRKLLQSTGAQRDVLVLALLTLAVALVEAMVNPMVANSGGLWISLGLGISLVARPSQVSPVLDGFLSFTDRQRSARRR